MKQLARPVGVVLAAAVLTMAVSTAGQTPSVLNTLEVKGLVSEDTPAADAALARHFTALADKYTAEAAAHAAMATAYSGNPNHSFNGSMAVHCKKLGDLATESAKTAREMVSYYDNLAAGVPAEAPKGAAAFKAGAGAPAPTAGEMKQLAAAAHARADHGDLQEYFLTLARQKAAEATEYASMANMLRVSGQRRGSEFAAMHSDSLAKTGARRGEGSNRIGRTPSSTRQRRLSDRADQPILDWPAF